MRLSKSEWKALISEYERTGGTIRAFCARKQVSEVTFGKWRKKLHDSSVPSSDFVEVASPSAAVIERNSRVTLSLPEGISITIERGVGI